MSLLAGRDDYEARYGEYDDGQQLLTLLASASSLVRHVAGYPISATADDEVTLYGSGTSRMFLPGVPVTAVESVVVDEATLDTADYSWRPWGRLDRTSGVWGCDETIVVTYTHGETVEWVVDLVCSIVQRAVRPAAVAGEQAITTGSQTVSYFTSAAGVSLWLTRDEVRRVRSLRGPVFA